MKTRISIMGFQEWKERSKFYIEGEDPIKAEFKYQKYVRRCRAINDTIPKAMLAAAFGGAVSIAYNVGKFIGHTTITDDDTRHIYKEGYDSGMMDGMSLEREKADLSASIRSLAVMISVEGDVDEYIENHRVATEIMGCDGDHYVKIQKEMGYANNMRDKYNAIASINKKGVVEDEGGLETESEES